VNALSQRGKSDLESGPAHEIDRGDHFGFLEFVCENDKDSGHG